MLQNERNTIKHQPLGGIEGETVYIPSSTAPRLAGVERSRDHSRPALSFEAAKKYCQEVRTDIEVKDADDVIDFTNPT